MGSERAFLKRLGGGCQLPIAAYGKIRGAELVLRGLVGSLDGRRIVTDEIKGAPADHQALGAMLAERILERGGREILAEAYEGGGHAC